MKGVAHIAIGCMLCSALPVIGQNYFLQGTAINTGPDCYQLTAAFTNQNGAVWYADLLDLTEPFDISFEIGLGFLDGNGADGIMFVLQTDGTNALGQSGGGLGFLGFNNAFGVEFDTWQNGNYGDPVYDHIGCVSDGSVDHNAPTAFGPTVAMINGNLNAEDGNIHDGRIHWEPATQLISVFFDCDERLTQEVDLINGVFGGTSEVYWGFTGSTGGSVNVQTVCLDESSLATAPEVTVCPGDSVQLSVIGSDEGTFVWSPSTYLSATDIPNPWCAPEETITYAVGFTGICGGEATTEYTVYVEPLTVSVTPEGPVQLDCENPTFPVQASSNFPNAQFDWSSVPANGFASVNGSTATVDAAGVFTVSASVNGGACAAEATFEVNADLEAYSAVLEADGSQLDCNTTVLDVTAVVSNGAALLSWNAPGSMDLVATGNSATVSGPGTLVCTVTNPDNGCATEVAFTTTADYTEPQVEAGWADTLTCADPSSTVNGVTISPSGYTPLHNWSWEPGAGGMNNTESLTPTALAPGWHTLTVTFVENGCSGSDSLFVVQDPSAAVDVSSIALPNVFSPNQDGKNDTFRPFLANDPTFETLGVMERYFVRVFNRWGNLVFENTGLPIRWDGTTNEGGDCSPGTYYVIVDYRITCGGVQEGVLTTEVELLRP